MPPHELTYETRTVKREKVLYSGPQAKNVYFLDFLCPQDAESVQTAPFIAHIYDMPATQIAQAYIARTQEAGTEDGAVPRIIDLLREAASITAAEPAAAAGVRAEDGARTADWVPTIEHRAGRVPIAECYMTMDVNGDGNPEEI